MIPIIQLSFTGSDAGHPLACPPECPMMEMGRDPALAASGDAVIAEEIAARGVAVGSVALVESSDGKVGSQLNQHCSYIYTRRRKYFCLNIYSLHDGNLQTYYRPFT